VTPGFVVRATRGLAKNAAIGSGIASEKSLLHRGRPTKIVEHQDPLEALRVLDEKNRWSISIPLCSPPGGEVDLG
jgi:hypothetical protein